MPGLNCYAAQIITSSHIFFLKIVVYGKKVKQHILRPYIHKQRLPLLHIQMTYYLQDYTTIQWMQVYVQNTVWKSSHLSIFLLIQPRHTSFHICSRVFEILYFLVNLYQPFCGQPLVMPHTEQGPKGDLNRFYLFLEVRVFACNIMFKRRFPLFSTRTYPRFVHAAPGQSLCFLFLTTKVCT